jgi:hypothetical protein
MTWSNIARVTGTGACFSSADGFGATARGEEGGGTDMAALE